jgi:hypothetical protein
VYSATAPAVPFLAELVRSEETDYRVRVELAWLLMAIAGGSSYLDVHRSLLEKEGETVDEAAVAEELAWVRAARDAVGREVPSFAPLLATEAPELLLSVAALAARFPEQSDQTRPLVQSAYGRTSDPQGRRVLALALILLGNRDGALLDEVRAASDLDADPELLADALPPLERGQTPEEAYFLLEDLIGAALRGWGGV